MQRPNDQFVALLFVADNLGISKIDDLDRSVFAQLVKHQILALPVTMNRSAESSVKTLK